MLQQREYGSLDGLEKTYMPILDQLLVDQNARKQHRYLATLGRSHLLGSAAVLNFEVFFKSCRTSNIIRMPAYGKPACKGSTFAARSPIALNQSSQCSTFSASFRNDISTTKLPPPSLILADLFLSDRSVVCIVHCAIDIASANCEVLSDSSFLFWRQPL